MVTWFKLPNQYTIETVSHATSFPGSSLLWRKDPGRSLSAKLKLYLGRGGRGVRLKNYNLCFIHDFSVLVQCTQVNMMLVMLL
jgi:hypothetical protein